MADDNSHVSSKDFSFFFVSLVKVNCKIQHLLCVLITIILNIQLLYNYTKYSVAWIYVEYNEWICK